jgi:hypothetical protein
MQIELTLVSSLHLLEGLKELLIPQRPRGLLEHHQRYHALIHEQPKIARCRPLRSQGESGDAGGLRAFPFFLMLCAPRRTLAIVDEFADGRYRRGAGMSVLVESFASVYDDRSRIGLISARCGGRGFEAYAACIGRPGSTAVSSFHRRDLSA